MIILMNYVIIWKSSIEQKAVRVMEKSLKWSFWHWHNGSIRAMSQFEMAPNRWISQSIRSHWKWFGAENKRASNRHATTASAAAAAESTVAPDESERNKRQPENRYLLNLFKQRVSFLSFQIKSPSRLCQNVKPCSVSSIKFVGEAQKGHVNDIYIYTHTHTHSCSRCWFIFSPISVSREIRHGKRCALFFGCVLFCNSWRIRIFGEITMDGGDICSLYLTEGQRIKWVYRYQQRIWVFWK